MSRSTPSGAYTAAFFASPHFGSLSIVLFSNVAQGFPGIHLPFWMILPLAVLVAATFGALLGAPTLRLRGDYLAIVTLGFGEIVPVFFKNLAAITFVFTIAADRLISLQNVNLTGGPLGINPIDPFVHPRHRLRLDARASPRSTSGSSCSIVAHHRRPQPRALAHGSRLDARSARTRWPPR